MLASVGPGPSELGAPTANPGRQGVVRLLAAAAGVAGAVSFGTTRIRTARCSTCSTTRRPGSRRLLADRPCRPKPSSAAPNSWRLLDNVRPRRDGRGVRAGAGRRGRAGAGGLGDQRARRRHRAPSRRLRASRRPLRSPIRCRRRARCSARAGGRRRNARCTAAGRARRRRRPGRRARTARRRARALAAGPQQRVRAPAQRLVDAMLRDDLAGTAAAGCWAAQTPAAPYAGGVDAAVARQWVGQPFSGAPLGDAPVTSAVPRRRPCCRRAQWPALSSTRGPRSCRIRWGTGGVAANLAAPGARAPHLILLAVPPDTAQPWTTDALLSVVDEALERAQCRLSSTSTPAATRRLLLPAIYLTEFNADDLGVRHLLRTPRTSSRRGWVEKGTSA